MIRSVLWAFMLTALWRPCGGFHTQTRYHHTGHQRRRWGTVRCGVSRRDVCSVCAKACISALALIAPQQAFGAIDSDLKSALDVYGRSYSSQRKAQISADERRKAKVSSRKYNAVPRPDSPEMLMAKERIRVLYAYLEEIERDIFARKWDSLSSYIAVFANQERAFERLISASMLTDSPVDRDTKRALEYEAQQIFLQLDSLAEATQFRDVPAAEKAYVALAIAYDRFLKAGDLYTVYDDVDTSKFYEEIPEDMLVFEREEKPKVKDDVLIVSGPDKGRTGKLIGVSEASGQGVVRVTYRKKSVESRDATFEVKVVELGNIAKTLPEKDVDPQMNFLMMCPGGLLKRCAN